MTAKKPSKIFFGWWTVAASSFLSLWGFGYYIYGFSAIFKPLATELGLSRAVTSVAAGIGRFGGGVEAPVTGWLTDKFGPKVVMLFGLSIFSIGLILMGFINSLWAFYIVWGGIVGLGLNTALSLPLEKAIMNWFVRKRGLAISIRWIFSGLLILPLISFFITSYGWRTACIIGGIAMLCVGLPLIWFFIKKERPEYYGLLPDGATDKASEEDASQMVSKGAEYAAEFQEIEFTLRQAMKTSPYWRLVVVQAIYGATMSSLLMHFVNFLTDMGIEPVRAASMVTISGIFSIASRFVSGFLADRVKSGSLRFVYAGGLLLQAGGITLFLLNQTLAMTYPFLILYYIGMGGGLIIMSVIGGRYFGRKAFGSIRGSIQMFSMPLGIMGPIYLGWTYDTTGSYNNALITFAILLTVSTVVMLFNRPPKPPDVITGISEIV